MGTATSYQPTPRSPVVISGVHTTVPLASTSLAISDTGLPRLKPMLPSPALIQSMSKLLQAQTEMLSAQTQAVAIQGLPALPKFSGENLEQDDETFERWLESFEDRAHLAGWAEEHKLYQRKMHLRGTALQVVRMMPKEEHKVHTTIISKLKSRFRPVDIEELKSMEFYRAVSQLRNLELACSIWLSKLSLKPLDQSLIGCLEDAFLSSIDTKWQRKLGAPKPGESFNDLCDRTRTLERQDKQFSSAAAGKPTERMVHSRSQQSHKTPALGPGPVVTQNNSTDDKPSLDSKDRDYNSRRRQGKRPYCLNCDLVGHHTRDCRSRSKRGAETKGNSTQQF